jgi:hypothetical protein
MFNNYAKLPEGIHQVQVDILGQGRRYPLHMWAGGFPIEYPEGSFVEASKTAVGF